MVSRSYVHEYFSHKVKKAATSAATSDTSMKSTTPRGRIRRPLGVMDGIKMSDVAADVAAFLAACTTDVLVADTTEVLYAAKAKNVLR